MTVDKNVTLEEAPCPVCCSETDKLVFTGKDYLHEGPGEFNLVQCETCGLLRTEPRPTPDSMGAYYPDDYGPYLGTRIAEKTSKLHALLKVIVKKIVNFRTSELPDIATGNMLEIGCASGNFLNAMSQKGWSVRGIEFSEQAAECAREHGFDVFSGALEDAPDYDETFDLIVGWMVLEHLHNPIACLEKLKQSSHSDTYLALSVPNAESLEFRVFKKRWYALQLPTHLYHFTPKTIENLLDKAGWRVERVMHQRLLTNVLMSVSYILKDKGFNKSADILKRLSEKTITNYALYPVAYVLGLFGQTGRMTIWAKPKNNNT